MVKKILQSGMGRSLSLYGPFKVRPSRARREVGPVSSNNNQKTPQDICPESQQTPWTCSPAHGCLACRAGQSARWP